MFLGVCLRDGMAWKGAEWEFRCLGDGLMLNQQINIREQRWGTWCVSMWMLCCLTMALKASDVGGLRPLLPGPRSALHTYIHRKTLCCVWCLSLAVSAVMVAEKDSKAFQQHISFLRTASYWLSFLSRVDHVDQAVS